MGLCNSPDIFQEKMNKILDGLDYFRIYIDDLLIISYKSLMDHIKKLHKVQSNLDLFTHIERSSLDLFKYEEMKKDLYGSFSSCYLYDTP